MSGIRNAIFLAAMALVALAVPAQNAGAARPAAGAATEPLIHIVSPHAGARLAQPVVTVQYELTNPAASPEPNFRVQLDGRDPQTTTTTSATFDGVRPGKHTVTVTLVDANGTPVAGSTAQVAFQTVSAVPPPAGARLRLPPPDPLLVRAALMEPEPSSPELPSAAGALPLLSVIGFGVLLGGIASAMKTR